MEQLDLLIKGGSVVWKDEVAVMDIGIRDGRIVQLGRSLEEACAASIVSAEGLTVMPGMVDVHVHLNEPGLGDWEGFESGSAALAVGGCTTYVDMPLNGIPPTVSVAAMELKLAAAAGRSHVDYALWGGLVPGKLHELAALSEAGVVGYKAFMSSPGDPSEDAFREVDDYTLLEGMKIIAGLGKVLALHAESEPIVARLGAQQRAAGKLSPRDYAESRPIIAELEAINRALFYAEQTGCALHFVHISSAAGVRAIRDAADRGMDVTLETCPHYLVLAMEDMERLGPVAKCSPPLRPLPERELLWEALAAGDIDMVSSDHSPCPASLKEAGHFFDAWGGIAGAQSSLELLIGEGHVKRGIPLPLLSRLLSGAPARRFGLGGDKGEIRLGAAADLALVDLNAAYTLSADQLRQRHKHSPYIGRTMHCQVQLVYLGGRMVYDRQTGLSEKKLGSWVK